MGKVTKICVSCGSAHEVEEPTRFPTNPKVGDKFNDGTGVDAVYEFGADERWHNLGDIYWRNENGHVYASW